MEEHWYEDWWKYIEELPLKRILGSCSPSYGLRFHSARQ